MPGNDNSDKPPPTTANTWAPADDETGVPDAETDESGVRLVRDEDRYELDRLLGRGGMGEVRRAWDRRLRRNVAMKVLAPGRSEHAARFAQEAQITGQLEHPNIVPVHELGRGPGGDLYLTMKEVRGQELSDEMEEVAAAVKQGETEAMAGLVRLVGILLKVCDGVAFAHSCDVVHRDLKPANVMVGEFGEVQVMDWGLARIGSAKRPGLGVTSDRLDDSIDMSRAGSVIGSPPYMAPEQARGDLDEIGPRTDIFAIGAILYEVLTGTRPWKGDTATEVLARARAGVVEPPSRRAPAAMVPRELEAIALKAMAREKADRYESVPAMAADMTAWLEGRPLATVQYGAPELALKWIRRNRPLVTGVSVTTSMAAVVLSGGLYRYVQDTKAEAQRALRAEAEVQESLAVQQVTTADALAAARRFADARETYGRALTALEATHQDTLSAELGLWATYHNAPAPMATIADRNFHPEAMTDGVLLGLEGEIWVKMDLPSGRRTGEWPQRGRSLTAAFEAGLPIVWEEVKGRVIRRDLESGIDTPLFMAAVERSHIFPQSSSGFIVESGGTPPTSRIWTEGPDGWTSADLGSGAMSWVGANSGIIAHYQKPSLLIELPGGRPIRTVEDTHLRVAEFEGQLALYDESEGSLRIEDLETGEVAWRRDDNGIRKLRFTEDGAMLLLTRVTPALEVVEPQTGETLTLLEGHTRATSDVYASGDLLVSKGADDRTLLWARPDFRLRGLLTTAVGAAARVSPDGRLLGVIGDELEIIDIATGFPLASFAAPEGPVRTFYFGDDEIALFASNGPASVLDLRTGIVDELLDLPAFVVALVGDDLVAMADIEGNVGLYERNTQKPRWLHQGTFEGGTWHLEASVDGKTLYGTGFREGHLVAWDVGTGEERYRVKVGQRAYETSLDPHSDRVAVGSWDGHVGIFDGNGERLHDLGPYDGPFLNTAFSPDGKYLAAGGFDGSLRFFDTETGLELREETLHHGPVVGVWWLDQRRIVSIAGDSRVLLHDLDLPARLAVADDVFSTMRTLPVDGKVNGEQERRLGDAMATHGAHTLALQAYDRASALGEDIGHLAVAREAWRSGDNNRAVAEFSAALSAGEAPEVYLQLCMTAAAR